MVATLYAAQRSTLAREIGLDRKAAPPPQPEQAPAAKNRSRRVDGRRRTA